MRRVDLLWSLVVLALAAAYLVAASDLPLTTRRGAPGAGVFPLYMGILLAIAGLLYLIQAILVFVRKKPGDDSSSGLPSRPAIVLMVYMIGYAIAMQTLGFLIGTFIFGFLLLSVYFRLPYVRALIVSLGMAVVVHFGFTIGFQVELPVGLIL
jgi:putative tricarboxylic transport membrane protein